MADKTDAQKRAQKKYMEKFVEVKVRMTPEKRSQIQDHAKKLGKSTTEFINRAIDETMERDNKNNRKTGEQSPVFSYPLRHSGRQGSVRLV